MTTALKRDRQAVISRIVATRPIGSQGELVDALRELGMDVTQATVSRDIAELGLVKVPRGDRHGYMSPADLAPAPPPRRADERLRRVLSDLPVTVGRSGLTVLLKASPGMANALGQAIDESSLDDQEGTLAGDDTLLVLFADERRLERWLDRFAALAASVSDAIPLSVTPAFAEQRRIPTEVSS
jgi:transcriptional regulator of arginine metabolism